MALDSAFALDVGENSESLQRQLQLPLPLSDCDSSMESGSDGLPTQPPTSQDQPGRDATMLDTSVSQPGSAVPPHQPAPRALPAASPSATGQQRRPRTEDEAPPARSRQRADLSSTVAGDLQRDIASVTKRLDDFWARADVTQDINRAALDELAVARDAHTGRLDYHEQALNELQGRLRFDLETFGTASANQQHSVQHCLQLEVNRLKQTLEAAHEAERGVTRDNYANFDRRLRAVEAGAPTAAPASAAALAAGPPAAQCAPTERRLDDLQAVVFGLSARAAATDGRVSDNQTASQNLKTEIEALRSHLNTSTAGQAQHNQRLDTEIADLDLKNVGLQLTVDDAITAVQSVSLGAGQHDARIRATEQLLHRMQSTVQQHEEAQRAALNRCARS